MSQRSTRSPSRSAGLSLLRSIVDREAVTELRSLSQDFFLEDEQTAFDFISMHTRRYNRVPSVTTCAENGITLPEANEAIEYYRDRLSKRYMFNLLRDEVLGNVAQQVESRNVDDAVASLRSVIRRLDVADPSNDLMELSALTEAAIREYRTAKFNPGLRGIPTGWPAIDDATNGFQGGDIGVIVGRPNVGKSYMLLWSLLMAWYAGYTPMLTSMEMSRDRLRDRILAMMASINPDLIRRGRMDMWTEQRFFATLREVEEMPPLHMLAGKYRKSVADISNAMKDSGADIGYVDAGYLLSPEKRRKSDAKHELIGDVIEELKAVSEDVQKPIIVTVQFNRTVNKKTKTGELDLSSIAGADAIGQIASAVIGVRNGEPPNEVTRRQLDLIKNREGPLMNLVTNFLFKPTLTMSQLAEEDYQDDMITEDDL